MDPPDVEASAEEVVGGEGADVGFAAANQLPDVMLLSVTLLFTIPGPPPQRARRGSPPTWRRESTGLPLSSV